MHARRESIFDHAKAMSKDGQHFDGGWSRTISDICRPVCPASTAITCRDKGLEDMIVLQHFICYSQLCTIGGEYWECLLNLRPLMRQSHPWIKASPGASLYSLCLVYNSCQTIMVSFLVCEDLSLCSKAPSLLYKVSKICAFSMLRSLPCFKLERKI